MADNTPITAKDLSDMATHWLGCPPGGYLGSDYGSDMDSILQTPMAAGLADGQIAKFRQDVPLAAMAPPGTINIYSYDIDIDKKGILFDVNGDVIPLDSNSA